MPDSHALLDKAIALCRSEMDNLATGDIDGALKTAEERTRLVDEAWKIDKNNPSDELINKLFELRRVQGSLTAEARRLHADLKEKLSKAKQESVRFAGYGKVAKGGAPGSVFVNKRG